MRLAALLGALIFAMPAAAEPVRLAAAGSLRAALAEVAQAFERAPGGGAVTQTYAPSGLLRQRIAGGEPFEVFASANMEHPEAVGRERNRPTVLFARNALCAIARAGLDVTPDEPPRPESRLWTAPNLVVTPHVGGQAARRIDAMTDFFCDNLRRYLADAPLRNVVDKRLGFPAPSAWCQKGGPLR